MPLPALAIAGLAAVGSAIGSTATSKIKNRDTLKYSKYLMKYQNELNIANWNMQNEYNLPVNERKRLQQAGINPNFGMGQSLSGQVASPSAQMEASAPDYNSSISTGLQAYTMAQQAENIKEDTRGKKIANDIQEEYGAFQADANVKLTLQNIQKALNEGNLAAAKKITEDYLREPQKQNIVANTEKINKEKDLLQPYYDLEQRKTEVSEQTYVEMKRHNLALERLTEELNDAQINSLNAKADYDKVQTAIQNFLFTTGRTAQLYDAQIGEISAIIANYKDMMLKRGIPPMQVLGNLLNGVFGDSTTFVSGLLDGLTNGEVKDLGDLFEVLSNNGSKALGKGLSVKDVKDRKQSNKKAKRQVKNSYNNIQHKKRAQSIPTYPRCSMGY